MSRFLLSPAPRQRLAAAGRLRRRILMPAFAGVAAASGTAVKDGPAFAQRIKSAVEAT